jgi:membrane protein DedA with SNARE-associated domain
MGQLLLIAFATFVSEDLTCIATGALIAGGQIGFAAGVLACIAGIYIGDLLLYGAGRLVGRPILRWNVLRRFLTETKVEEASRWLSDHGARVVLASRFTPGLRLPTYLAAGLLKTRFWTFAAYFLLAAVVWTPLLVGGTVVLGEGVLRASLQQRNLAFVAAVFLTGITLQRLYRWLCAWPNRRRLMGKFRRWTRWEFWPPWLAYIPLVPYILYLGVRHRSFTLFTAANPGIPSGGFVGESKSRILGKLPCVPDFALLLASLSTADRQKAAARFMAFRDLRFPVVLKPDVGERGSSVAIVQSEDELRTYLASATVDTIIQRYVGGQEFGIFYYRYPGDSQGRIFSITEKRFPVVVGDGKSTISDLILKDERAVCLAGLYLDRLRHRIDDVPEPGETVTLAELGSHCRGAVFLDGNHLKTEALRAAVEGIAQTHPGFYFGRFDIRSASIARLQAGQVEVLELNGVSAEATHIYDPAVGAWDAYRVMFRQWRIAFEIAALNCQAGARPMGIRQFVSLVTSRGTMEPKTSPDPGQLVAVQHQHAERAHENH